MKHIVVVGGGVSGMSAAIFASLGGAECEIFEKQPHFGGNLTGWKRQGCYIDNCIHWLVGTNHGNALFEKWREIGMLGDGAETYRNRSFFESEYRGERVALWATLERTRKDLLAHAPEDKEEIERFLRTVERMIPLHTGGNLLERAGLLHSVPDLLYYQKNDLFSIAKDFHSPLLRHLLTDYIGGEYNGLSLVLAYSAYVSGNGSLLRGGSFAAAERIKNRCLSVGCILHPAYEVEKIEIRDGRATGVYTADGDFHPADCVICACDPCVTFGKLLPETMMPSAYRKLLFGKEEIRFSALQAAFVFDGIPEAFGVRVIDAPSFSKRKYARMMVKEYSAEPEFAPIGKTVLQTMIPLEEEAARIWVEEKGKDPDLYLLHTTQVAEKMRETIESAIPETKGKLKVLDVWSPATYQGYFGNPIGAFLAPAMTPRSSIRSNPGRVEGVDALILATQWSRSPGGLPNALLSGEAAAKLALCEKSPIFSKS